MLNAARRAGVQRIVYTSSVATIGIPADGAPGDERTAVTLDDMIGHYKRSKYLAEEVVREIAREAAAAREATPWSSSVHRRRWGRAM